MAIPKRASIAGTDFITSVTAERRRIFQVEAKATLFLETLQHDRQAGNYKLHAFVVMPDHIHLLLTPAEVALERTIGLVKGAFSHQVASNFPVWQRSFTHHRIVDRGATTFTTILSARGWCSDRRTTHIHRLTGGREI